MKRIATKYPGVFYREVQEVGGKGTDKVFYVVYKKDGKTVEAKAGSEQRNDMTPAKANDYRSDLIRGKDQTPAERRSEAKAAKAAMEGRYTIKKLWGEYIETRPKNKAASIDTGRYEKYIRDTLGDKEPKDILPLDIKRLTAGLEKAKLSPQSTKHVLNLLTWIINYGSKNGLCPCIPFQIKKPTVNNIVSEDLTDTQIKALLSAIEADPNRDVAAMLLLILNTGMRRGELFKLKWEHIDFERGFISIRDPKGGKDQQIPMNKGAVDILREQETRYPKAKPESFVFPGENGAQRVSVQKAVKRIRAAAGLPSSFRPMHGLRHTFASMLASSGKVDMYQLQRLLTHKDPRMTQRYAHLRDDALKSASDVAGDIIGNFTKEAAEDTAKEAAKS